MSSVLKSIARRVLPRSVRNWLRSPSAALRWWLNECRSPIPLAIRPDCSRAQVSRVIKSTVKDYALTMKRLA